ncbi:GspE/PulE family protein [Fluviicola sp.]|uniref:GspE/PulE family protein n=1 Tax=Fluviicola sp. TaxID=1917219 RepID=UPI0026139B38|nr:GspE/PulE family protein [Fluviicola sp.]
MSEVNNLSVSAELQQVIPSDLAWHYRVIPREITEELATFYIDNTQHLNTVAEELTALLGKNVELVPEKPDVIQRSLGKFFRRANQEKQLVFNANTDFVDRIIQDANHLGSSDIHIEIYEDRARVRIRIDGHLIERYSIDKTEYSELVNKVKIRSNLDISEKRLPQDGRIQYQNFDIRVSILPTLHGEKIVMRILGKDASSIQITQLGLTDNDLRNYLEGIKKPHGIVLISGPTGSGKTTTLYATLKQLNDEKRNIVTVEDPIEYTLEGINQVQLKEQIGLTFASALRSFLRQDPDVIMLGEIRDGETAQMAIRAALTGHLVLSTIHTNSAWGTISRLIDMGVPSFLIASTINTSVAQRLLRKLCTTCKQEVETSPLDWPRNFNPENIPSKVFEAVGCDDCHFTGYKGRTAIYEVIPIDFELSESIKNNDSTIEDKLVERDIITLNKQALELIKSGITSLEEAYPILTEI